MTTPAPLPTTEQIAAEHAVSTGITRAMALNAAMQLWAQAPPNIGEMFAWWFDGARDQMFTQVSLAQEMVAMEAPAYVEDVMGVQGWEIDSPLLVPERFAAVASDGRPLDTLLDRVPFAAESLVREDQAEQESAIRQAEPLLQRIVHTQVTDASREADGVVLATSETVGPIAPDWSPRVLPRQQAPRTPVSDEEFLDANEIVDPWARRRREQKLAEAKAANRSPIGWIRMLSPPSCGRCAVLAGRWYGWNEGFQRHPNCDCRHIPAIESDAGDMTTDPRVYFDSLSQAEQDELFGVAAAEAIRNGADIAQVINAQNREGGSYTVDGRQYTREGTTRKGYYGGQVEAGQKRLRRPTPVQIYRDARGDRDEAVRLLTKFGYIL